MINITPENMKNLDAELYGKVIAAAEHVVQTMPGKVVSFQIVDRKLVMYHADCFPEMSKETMKLFTPEELSQLPVWIEPEAFL